MGCAASTPVSPKQRAKRPEYINDDEDEREPTPRDDSEIIRDTLSDSLETFRQSVTKVPQPNGLFPLVSLSEHSLPLAFAPVCGRAGMPLELELPTVVAGMVHSRRILLVSHIEMVARCDPRDPELSAFLEFIVTFSAATQRDKYHVLILACPTGPALQIQQNLRASDVVAEVLTEPGDLRRYQVVITTPEYPDFAMFDQCMKLGRGMVFCGVGRNTKVSPQARKLFEEFGIGVPRCTVALGDPAANFRRLPTQPKVFMRRRFPHFCEKFVQKCTDPENCKLGSLDKLVAKLRYCVSSLTDQVYPDLGKVWEACWRYLDATGCYSAEDPDTFGSTVGHEIVSSLLVEIMVKVPAEMHEVNDRSRPFPGPCELELTSYRCKIEATSVCWYSTGLYLPAGVVSTVTVPKPIENCYVQIGSHTNMVQTKPMPWKRFASVITRFRLDQKTIKISSPFGGIVYIITKRDDVPAFEATFRGIGRYPTFSVMDVHIWEEAKVFKAPWSEFETAFAIFTLPTPLLLSIFDPAGTADEMDELLKLLLTFTADDSVCPNRIIFDIETDSQNESFYPIVLPVEAAQPILELNEPSEWLLKMLARIAARSIPAEGFPRAARVGLAAVAAFAVADQHWPRHDQKLIKILALNNPLFQSYLAIYQQIDPEIWPKAFEHIRTMKSRDESSYRAFVGAINRLSNSNFSAVMLDHEHTADRPKLSYNLESSHRLLEFRLAKEETSPLPG
jgi:hypothetical protein